MTERRKPRKHLILEISQPLCSSSQGWKKFWGKKRIFWRFSHCLGSVLVSNSYLFIWHGYFAKKNGSKRPFLPEIDAQTFWYTLYRVPTACCVSWQIPKTQQGNHLGAMAHYCYSNIAYMFYFGGLDRGMTARLRDDDPGPRSWVEPPPPPIKFAD